MTTDAVKEVAIARAGASVSQAVLDVLAVEEPLEIRVAWVEDDAPRLATIAVTMRTPGDDDELAAGFLFTEGIVRRHDEILGVRSCGTGSIRVELASGAPLNLARVERHGFTSSSCGACGKTSTAALRAIPPWPLPPNGPYVGEALIHSLPASLRRAQSVFDATGGLHASGLFDLDGQLLMLREDVGRHNALDKVIGAELLADRLPADERILMVSGRVSFELVQKALMAGIPVLAAVGAPSSLAVDIAREAGMTLVGFVRADRFNIYSGAERLRSSTDQRGQLHGRTRTKSNYG